MGKSTILYSTDPDWKETCPRCDEPIGNCICPKDTNQNRQANSVNIRREVKGRGGKTVTTIANMSQEPKKWQKEFQRLCGAGGTLKNGIIEIQGDQREKIKEYLIQQGFQVKFTGG